MRWLLDSNVLIDALAGLSHGVRVLEEARKRPDVSVIYSAITRIEVLGFPDLSEQEEAAIRRLLNELEKSPLRTRSWNGRFKFASWSASRFPTP
jgi:predicted nucleic acid-binding protein